MSWLAAARKRVLERFASSAAVLARASSALRRCSSAVRSSTRFSRSSLAASRSSSVCTVCGHVGVGGHDAAVRQTRRADLDHPARGEEPQAGRLIVVEEALRPARRRNPPNLPARKRRAPR